MMATSQRFPRGLYGITPGWDDTDRLITAVEQAASGGMVALQWRHKAIDAPDRLSQARRLGALCRERNILFIVNDDWRLAAMIDADGVHLGREDGSVAQARLALGEDKIVGCSCYNDLSLGQQALEAGADYIAFGSVYPSRVKPDAVRAGLDLLREAQSMVAQQAAPAAVVAIGGITLDNAAPVIAAGADSLAVISGLFETDDIAATAAAYCRLFA